ncbi:unnamed protein product, partial [Bubo scandiacus]
MLGKCRPPPPPVRAVGGCSGRKARNGSAGAAREEESGAEAFRSQWSLRESLEQQVGEEKPICEFFSGRGRGEGGRHSGGSVAGSVRGPASLSDPMASSCRCSNWWWKRKRQTSRAEGPARQESAAGEAEEVWATSGGKRRALRAKRR